MCKQHTVSDALKAENSLSAPVESRDDVVEIAPETRDTVDPPASSGDSDALAAVNQSLSVLHDLFEKQISRSQHQAKMFDAMYNEMKEYKENFLLDALHKPLIQNLIQFYDSFVALASQFDNIIGEQQRIRPKELPEEISLFQKNLENVRSELEEVLYRMDVTPYEKRLETLDRKLHKTLDVIPTDTPEADQKVAKIHKIGFYWRDKVFRPEEVTIFRYTLPVTEGGEDTDG